jgi:hypothetical protein
MYLMPGFVDMHGHSGGNSQGTPAEYVFKLWMSHGITTIRDPSAGNGLDWILDQKQKSSVNLITAPRIYAYTAFGMGSEKPISTPEQAKTYGYRKMRRRVLMELNFLEHAPANYGCCACARIKN